MGLKPGQTEDHRIAQLAVSGTLGNARTVVLFGVGTFGELSLNDSMKVLQETAKDLNDGDLRSAVTMLASQAVALNAIFSELARRSVLNLSEYLGAGERYMKLALRAQGQCRATLETLAAIKNPTAVFARQANINNGGQQQVNNGAPMADRQNEPPAMRAQQTQRAPNELLEVHDGDRLDRGA